MLSTIFQLALPETCKLEWQSDWRTRWKWLAITLEGESFIALLHFEFSNSPTTIIVYLFLLWIDSRKYTIHVLYHLSVIHHRSEKKNREASHSTNTIQAKPINSRGVLAGNRRSYVNRLLREPSECFDAYTPFTIHNFLRTLDETSMRRRKKFHAGLILRKICLCIGNSVLWI